MSFVVGLTGSIGMGKSTTAQLFADEGCPVWDADAAVHRLYAQGGLAVAPMQAIFPEAIEDGAVSREKLKAIIAGDASALKRIEAVVHPLVAQDRAGFLARHPDEIVILDIPLLFETGAADRMDAVVVVSVDAAEQRRRVLGRGTMSAAQFETILAKQTPDAEKREKADYIVLTTSPAEAWRQVREILADIRGRKHA
ncbi:MAG: dephospho-CoA kinase [Paracoccaceae bacterium]|jgi:dephospho-CoA kinase|nr:dephospho-CoA kinase [Paracoccaceae bacterium]MDP7186145.1 dephospho-CoA kinase [Paracoccaceae bacterium]